MFDRLGAFVAVHWRPVIVAWVVLAAALAWIAPRWDDVTHDGDLAYLPETLPSVEGERLLARAFPDNKAKSEIGIVVERVGAPLTLADLQWSDRLADRFRQREGDLPILEVRNRNTEVVGDMLVSRASPRGQAALTLLLIKNEFMAVGNLPLLDEIERMLAEARRDLPEGLRVGVTGSAAIGTDMLRSASESIRNTEWTTIALVIIILLVVYRAPLLVMVPLVAIGLSLVVSLNLLALLTQLSAVEAFAPWWNFKVFTTTKIFIVVILFGAGTDFCLFLISRYKEELEHGLSRDRAVAESVSRVGEALLGSAMTTVCGLGMMYFADFGKFRNSGPAIAVCLLVTLAACLTMAPALLRATGRAVFWPAGLRAKPQQSADDAAPEGYFGGFWQWAADAIIRRPGTILVASVVLLAPIAYHGLAIDLTFDALNELDARRPSVVGAEMARRHFAAGEMAPVTVLALKEHADFDSRRMNREIARLTKQLYDVEGIEAVRSLTEPTGDKPGYLQPFRASGLRKLAARKHKTTEAQYVTRAPGLKGEVARFDIILEAEPFSPAAVGMLDRLDDYLYDLSEDPESAWHQSKFVFVGTTSGIRDMAAVTGSDQTLIQRLVVLGVLAVLLVLLRRPLVCFYLIVSVLFSYFVTIGATQWFFAWFYGESFQGLDWKVPIFLFVILIAIGEDYNIYLVTRVFEEQRRFGPIEGLRRAVARTGGIITSCGVIMAGTFISMITGTLRGMMELGFALSLGVMLDTCVVRPILVPAFLALVERVRPSGPATAVDASLGGSHRAMTEPSAARA